VTDPAISELERNLAAARRKLDALRATSPAGVPRRAERQDEAPAHQQGAVTAHGSGEAADGRVRVVAVSNGAFGSIESVELEPRLLRMEAAELADQVRATLNAALDDMRANAWAAPAATASPGIDLGALAKRLTEVQEQATRQLYQLTSALQDVLAKIGRDANVSGAVAVPDVNELFQETLQTLASAAAAPDGTTRPGAVPAATTPTAPLPGPGGNPRGSSPRVTSTPASAAAATTAPGAGGFPHAGFPPDRGDGPAQDQEQSRGEGEAGLGGLVRAVAGPGGHVESLAIDPAAVRKGSHEVAGYVAAAVNAAMDDYSRKQRPLFDAAAGDRAALAQRVRTVQDLSLRQMRAFGESLAGLIAGIAPRS
jgi:DNA-binding protein YbaB